MLVPKGRRRRWPWIAAAGAALVAAGSVALYLAVLRPPGDVSNRDVDFESPRDKRRGQRVTWPVYGYDLARTHYLPVDHRPPLRRVWKRPGAVLLEFQPVLARGRLYLVKNDGRAFAIDARTGRFRWRQRVGSLNASSPAYAQGRLFIVSLSRRITCLDARTGRVRWRRELPSRSESSPLVRRGRVYFGSEDGTIYALRARDGRTIWTHRAAGAVKAALAYARGRLYCGDYAGQMTALRVRDGSRVWNTATQGRSFRRSGRFYSTPAVAFGRVYVGNTDGRVYSFSAHTGQLAWSRSTGGYVYAAPAVADVPGTRPSVYIGSYDGTFYALDARTGAVRWTHDTGGKISGAASVIGRVVYFSDLGGRSTIGLDVRRGRRVFSLGNGAFNPAIADHRRVYVTGYSAQYAFEPARKWRRRR